MSQHLFPSSVASAVIYRCGQFDGPDRSCIQNCFQTTNTTNQYLLWTSEHPTAHKLVVVKTLYEWASNKTEEGNKQEEKYTSVTHMQLIPDLVCNEGH